MAITQVEDGEEKPVVVSPRSPSFAQPTEAFVEATLHGPDTLDYRTEVCTLELLFADYIGTLIPVAESFSPDEQVTSRDIDQVVFLLRTLRETVIAQLSECLRVFPDNDPFFPHPAMPQLAVVREKDIEPFATIPLSLYLQRLSVLHPHFAYDGILGTVSQDLFRVGVKPGDEGKHYLILPEEKVLLRTAGSNNLFFASSY